ncbi:hypothetical protein ES703_08920 [subsurface metagenome]
MPSRQDTAKETPVALTGLSIAERKNAVVRPTSLLVDNQAGGQDVILTIRDDFESDVAIGQVAETKTITRWKSKITQGDLITWNEEDLKGVKCLGALKVISDVDETGCEITLGYQHE